MDHRIISTKQLVSHCEVSPGSCKASAAIGQALRSKISRVEMMTEQNISDFENMQVLFMVQALVEHNADNESRNDQVLTGGSQSELRPVP